MPAYNNSKHHFLLSIIFMMLSLTTQSSLFSAAKSPDVDHIILEKNVDVLKNLGKREPAAVVTAFEQLLDPKKQKAKQEFHDGIHTWHLDKDMLRQKSFTRLLGVFGDASVTLADKQTAKLNSYLLHMVMVKKLSSQSEKPAYEQFLTESVRSLVDNKADVNFQPTGGFIVWPALELAYAYHRPDIAKTLLDAKADPTLHEQFSIYKEGMDSRYNDFIKALQPAAPTAPDSVQEKPKSDKAEEKTTTTKK